MSSFEDLIVYKEAFSLAMEIFHLTKMFPKEERYSLIDQIRRSSRSVCQSLAEAYRKRRYIRHFISKLTDADAELSETKVWLDFSYKCGYLGKDEYNKCTLQNANIGKLLGYMINNPELFL